jgi:hypothetical protein
MKGRIAAMLPCDAALLALLNWVQNGEGALKIVWILILRAKGSYIALL